MKFFNIKKISLFTVAILCVAGGIYQYKTRVALSSILKDPAISNYEAGRDKAFIKQQFKENWYTMTPDPTMDVDFLLDNLVPSKHQLQHTGKMAIKMLYENNEPVGFISYYMATRYQGHIQFLIIAADKRGKRSGEKLMNYALEDLKRQGAKTVKIYTRTENLAAQKLYKRVGFIESDVVSQGIYLRKEL